MLSGTIQNIDRAKQRRVRKLMRRDIYATAHMNMAWVSVVLIIIAALFICL